nr:RHS repeat-associated core domain-containing protein [Rhodanobacter glycinis]
MTIAAKHFDPQLGLDIHLYEIPPSPIPIPLPTPHIGIVFDPFDYIPFIGGTVHVHGIKRATAGTGGLNVHIPVGGLWVPPEEAPEGPQFDDQLFMGSQTVVADSAPFSKLCMPVLDCNMVGMIPPLRLKKPKKPSLSLTLPTAVNLAIPSNVSVGGAPTIDMMGLLFQAGFAGALKGLKALKKLKRFESAMEKFKAWRKSKFGEMPSGFLKCKVLRAEPVDIRDGSVAVEHEDFAIPGRLPLAWPRVYRSRNLQSGLCGHGWQTPADLHLDIDTDGIAVFVDTDRHVVFPQLPAADGFEHAVTELVDGARLYAEGTAYRVRTKDGLVYAFPRPPRNVAALGQQRLSIERIEDLCGNHWCFERIDGRLTRIQESGIDGLQGRFIDVTVHGNHIRQLLLHDPATGINHPLVSYDYDEAGDLVAAIDPLGAPRTFEYAKHHLVRHTDRTGLSFHYEYNALQQVIHAWGDGGLHDYRFHYDEALQETEVTDSLSHVSLVKFDENGLPLCEIDPLDGVTVFEYDDVGRTTAVVDPMGLRTEFEYDERGNLLKLTRADGSAVETAYDENDHPVAMTDAAGANWQQQWNEHGLLHEQRTPLGATTRYTYDAHGQLTGHINALGAATRLAFDRHGSLLELIDPMGQANRFEHDTLGRLLSRTDATGRSSRYRYDAKGRLLEIISPTDARVHCEYDAEDQLVRYRDEAGHVTQLDYTGIGQLARRRQPDGHDVRYEYDTEERLVAVINQRAERYELKRDPLGRIVEEIDYWGQGRRYDYDAAGRLRRSTDPLGRVLGFDTDALGRITRKTLPNPRDANRQIHETFRYNEAGQLVELRNTVAHVTRNFDAEGRLLQEVQNGFTVDNIYDALGNRIERHTSAGNTVRIGFDVLGRPERITINDAAPITIERNASGLVVAEQLTPTLRRTLDYNADGLLTAQAVTNDHTPLFDTRYAYDRTGNLTERTDSVHGTDRYNYDPMGRVLEHTDPAGKLTRWLNDPAGDRLKTRVLEVRMKQAVGGAPLADAWTREGDYDGRHYVFDRAGNLIRRQHHQEPGRPTLHLAWDANQRLAESHWEGGDHDELRTTYGYDPLGRRVFKRNPTHTTWFFWDGDALLGEVAQPNEAAADHTLEPVTQSNVIDFVAASRRLDALTTLHPKAREYVCNPGTYEPLALVDNNIAQASTLAADGIGNEQPVSLSATLVIKSDLAQKKKSTAGTAALPSLTKARVTDHSGPEPGSLRLSLGHGAMLGGVPSLVPPRPTPATGEALAPPQAPDTASHALPRSPAYDGQGDEPMGRWIAFYHNEPNGSPARITNAAGETLWSVSYTAWGAIQQIHTAKIKNPLRLQGQYEDPESGLSYNRHRYYASQLGQFISSDPLRMLAGENLYAYASNSIEWSDPLGLAPTQSGVPGVANNEFSDWFNNLTPDEFDEEWAKHSDVIKNRLRHPGGMHEWLLVSRANVFKRWGIKAEQIWTWRTPTRSTGGINPNWKHGRAGSTTAHNEVLDIIDSSTSFEQFKRRLNNWASYRLTNGNDDLPAGLRIEGCRT